MNSILERLGLKQSEPAADKPGDKLGVIAGRLEDLEPTQARLVAAFATVLVRTARSDLHVSEEESARMRARNQAGRHTGLPCHSRAQGSVRA